MDDGTDRLCQVVYGRSPKAEDYLGGSNAKMLHDAADKIEELKKQIEELKDKIYDLEDKIYDLEFFIDEGDD